MEMFFRHHRLSLTCKGYSRDNKEKCKYFFEQSTQAPPCSKKVSRLQDTTERKSIRAVKLASACRRNNFKLVFYMRKIIRFKENCDNNG